jgi:hypothetical protein
MKKEDPKDKDVYIPGDEVCTFCYGITYIYQTMRGNRKSSLCIGVRKISPEKIALHDLDQFEKHADRDFLRQICIGSARDFFSSAISQLHCLELLLTEI